jgi:hypothetical protein
MNGPNDNIWRPERQVSGRWVAVRYKVEGTRPHRYVDGVWRGGTFLGNYFDTMDQCIPRCAELNK